MAKLTISKVTADGEQTLIEEEITPGDDHGPAKIKYLYKLMDNRLWEMNKRVIAANYLCKKLPAEAQMAIHNMMDVLHGRKPGPSIELIVQEATEEMLKQREDADEADEDLSDSKQPSNA